MAYSPGPGLTLIDFKHITLKTILGRGGFGEVYKARHVNWGDVAVKRLQGVTLTTELQKEADRMLRVVSSPYLVRIMGLIKNPGDVGIVMEYFKYGSLKEFENKYMKCDCWARKVKMVQDIALGMNYLHTLDPPIIHRDLKLENVFVGGGFEAKIGDLGLAVSSKTSIRKAGVAGTTSHFPPEASSSTEIEPDEFWDIFTFAITSYELVSGKDPWPQQQQFANDALVAVWVYRGHRPDLKVIPPESPQELVDLIKECWVAQPKERPTFKDILACVTELFDAKYKRVLRRADRSISEQIDRQEEDESNREQGGASSAADGGLGSDFWGSFGNLRVRDHDTSTSTSGKDQETSMSTDVRGQYTTMKAAEIKGQDVSMSTGVKGQDVTIQAASVTESARSNQGTALKSGVDESNMTWQYRHSIDTDGDVKVCHMICQDQQAVCVRGKVMVYKVTSSQSHLMYTLTSDELKFRSIVGVAVSKNSMLVICHGEPYVYQCPYNKMYNETMQTIMKHKIGSDETYPWCLVANDNTAVIRMMYIEGMNITSSVYQLGVPGFNKQSCVQVNFFPSDLSITSDFLVIMGDEEMVVRSLSYVRPREDECMIKSPVGWRFSSVCCRNNAREIYAACKQGDRHNEKGSVYRYKWGGVGKPAYGKPTCIIEGLGIVADNCLSVTSDGLLAVGQPNNKVKVYKLQ